MADAQAQIHRSESIAWVGPSVLIFAAFGLLGFTFGTWQVILADLQRELVLSSGALGGALTAGVAGSLPAVWLGGRAADRWGARALMVAAALGMGLALAGVFFARDFWQLVPLLFLLFSGTGTYDVGINTAAIRVEQVSGRRILPYAHAAFSGASALGALSAGLLLSAGMPFRWLYAGLAALVIGFAILVWRSPVIPGRPDLKPEAAATKPGALIRSPAILVITAITLICILSEGTLENWSSIYLRSFLALPVVLGAAGVMVYHSAMLTGRLAAGRVLARMRRRTFLLLAGLLLASGMSLALATTITPIIFAGFLLSGLALAGIVPTALSLAGDMAPDRAGEASSVIFTVGYGGFLIGPFLIGSLAELFSLRVALGTVVVAGLLIAALSRAVRAPAVRRGASN